MSRVNGRSSTGRFRWGVILLIAMGLRARGHALGLDKQLRQYGEQTWQSDSGLPQNTVHAVLQTRDGFLWLGTDAGLVRFDGVEFRVFDTETVPQMKSNVVNDLAEDAAGGLWVSTMGGLLRIAEGRFRLFTVADGLPSNLLTRVHVSHAGEVIALTASGAAVLRGGRFTVVAGVTGAALVAEDAEGRVWFAGAGGLREMKEDASVRVDSVGEIQAVVAAAPGVVWVGGHGGVMVVKEGKASRVGGLPSEDVTALAVDGQGTVWIGTAAGLAASAHGAVKIVDGLKGAHVQMLSVDREGAVWVASDRGVARIVNGLVDPTALRRPLRGVTAILEDREGSMWFGTETAGLTVLREQAFSTIGPEEGVTAGVVRAVFQDHAGTIWLGTDGGGLERITVGRSDAEAAGVKISSSVVLALAETKEGLWVGTPNGLNLIHEKVHEAKVFTTADGLPDDFVRSLYADRDGSLWVGTRNGLAHLVAGRFQVYSTLDGLGGDLIGSMVRSRSGVLWVGTLGGLSRMEGEGFVLTPKGGGAAQEAVTALLEDHRGELWVGMNGGGLSRVTNGVWRTFPVMKDGLPETVYGMLEDSRGDLWLSSRKGIHRVSLAALDAFAKGSSQKIPVETFGTADGLNIGEGSGGGHPAAWRMKDGTLWFATLRGATSVNPQTSFRNAVAPLTAIEDVQVDDQVVTQVEGGGVVQVPPGKGRLTIHYAGLSFVAPQKVRYRYRLKGFDADWVEVQGRRTAYYTNVPPGRYEFAVLSSNNDGVWSEKPTTLVFEVKPYFMQTRWFYGLLALLAGVLVYLAYWWRVRSVRNQYQAVMAERGRIAREIHDTLAQGYVAIAVQLEVAEQMLKIAPDAAVRQIAETKEIVKSSLEEARSSIWNLRSEVEPETLVSRVSRLVESARRTSAANISVEVHGTYRPLSREVEDEVFRIVQESVANAVRHAQAKQIVVALSYDTNALLVRVTDDGQGFEQPMNGFVAAGHYGLKGLRERADRIGASLKVDSSRGQGTAVEMHLEIPQTARKVFQ